MANRRGRHAAMVVPRQGLAIGRPMDRAGGALQAQDHDKASGDSKAAVAAGLDAIQAWK
jgi:hypothetical protein